MNEKITAFTLSFVSGFVDTAGFIALGGVFTAHVTGNFVLAGASLARASTEGVFVKLLMFPIFVAAVGLSYWLACFLERRRVNALFVLMLLEALLLLAFAVVGYYFQPQSALKMSETQIVIAGAIGVGAMALQNAYMKLHLPKMTMTTVMTGNVTQFSIDLMKTMFGIFNADANHENSAEIRARLSKVGTVILGFLSGSIGGAFLFMNFTLLAVLLPAGLILITAFGQPKPAANEPH